MSFEKCYKPLGWSEDVDTCGRCGKTGLMRVFAVEEVDAHGIVYFGSECMKKAAGYTVTVAEKKVAADLCRRQNEYGRRIQDLQELKAIHAFECSCGRHGHGQYRPYTEDESAILDRLKLAFHAVADPIAKELGV